MNVNHYSPRSLLNSNDIAFIIKVLATAEQSAEAILNILASPDSRDLLLDRDELLRALLEFSEPLAISPNLYFYVLVRRALCEQGLMDRPLADYVAGMLVKFHNYNIVTYTKPGVRSALLYATDELMAIDAAMPKEQFYRRIRLGNLALIVTGLFPDHIKFRHQRYAAPSLRYYETLGSTQFKIIRNNDIARFMKLRSTFAFLDEDFAKARQALNTFRDKYILFHHPDLESLP